MFEEVIGGYKAGTGDRGGGLDRAKAVEIKMVGGYVGMTCFI